MRLLRLFAALLLTLLPTACGNLNFYSEEEEASLGAQAYAEETGKYPLVTRGNDYEMVQRVGRKIAEASGKPYQWEFKLLKADDVPNAFCLPGGKVAIYTGILPITQNEAGLAAVMGHEVAHATERHGGKRMTQGNIANVLTSALGAGLSLSEMSPDVQQGVMKAFAIGAQVGVLLPYSRDHETEADEIGIRYAIRAGYDPWEAPKLWERMAALSGDGGGPAWLSTHPASLDRAENLKQKIPLYLEQEKGWKPKQLAPSVTGGNR
ncbi:MAG: M48 family metallopeptidase [Planctomycetes bacterium]|nr:M48 family metallopeptidase [Planctomycetota bacterium]